MKERVSIYTFFDWTCWTFLFERIFFFSSLLDLPIFGGQTDCFELLILNRLWEEREKKERKKGGVGVVGGGFFIVVVRRHAVLLVFPEVRAGDASE